MPIRSKLLILLASVTLLPAVIVIVLDRHLVASLVRELTSRYAVAMGDQAQATMNRIAADYADALDRETRRVRLLLTLQAAAAERALHAPPAGFVATARPYFDEDFQAGHRALELTTDPAPKVAHNLADGTVRAVSWRHLSQHIAPGTQHADILPLARALARLADFYRSIREPRDPLLGWHYVVLREGLSATYPGHGGMPAEFDPRLRPWWGQQRDNPGFSWHAPHYDASTGNLLVNATMPLFGADGDLIGLTGIDVDLGSTLSMLELPEELSQGSELMLVALVAQKGTPEPEARVFARLHGTRESNDWRAIPALERFDLGHEQATNELVAAMRRGDNGQLRARLQGQDSFVLYHRWGEAATYVVMNVPVAQATRAATAASKDAADATHAHVRRVLVFILLAAIVVVLLALTAAHRITRPIEELERAVRRLAGGDFTARVPITTRDELRTLGEAFNAMVPRLQALAKTEESLALAHEVQQQLLPRTPPKLTGYDISGITLYSEQTGGDYFDYVELFGSDPQSLGVVVADVSGHGIGPALLMATTRALLRGARDRGEGPGDVLSAVNRELAADIGRGHFVTLFVLVLNSATGALRWASAGHDPALVFVSGEATVHDLATDDIPLGIDGAWSYATTTGHSLRPGDIVIIGTDGIWDSRNAGGEHFGKQRMRDCVTAHQHLSAAEIRAALEQALTAFRADSAQRDDVTIVVVKRAAPADEN